MIANTDYWVAVNPTPFYLTPVTRILNPSHMAQRLFLALFLTGSLLAGCRSTQPESSSLLESLAASSVSYTETTDALPPDPEIESIIIPYRAELQTSIEEVIGEATGLLEKGRRYETTLGNMAADAMLDVINTKVDTQVDIALTNNGGLRVPIQEGPITVGKIFELMPFENTMVILEYDASGIDSLAQQIARSSGAIAGLSFKVDTLTYTAFDIQVSNQPLDSEALYRVVTSDYLANGGGRITILRTPLNRVDLPLLLRDAFIEYIREKNTIVPTLDGRIQATQK